MIKTVILLLILAVQSEFLYGQTAIGYVSRNIEGWNKDFMGDPAKLHQDDYDRFVNSTTYFIIPNTELGKKELYEKMMNEVWTITPLKFLTREEAKKLDKGPETSFITFGITDLFISGKYGYSQYFYFEYNVTFLKPLKKGDILEINVATIKFTPSHVLVKDIVIGKHQQFPGSDTLLAKNLLSNYGLGFLKAYFKNINAALLSNSNKSLRFEGSDKAEMQKLKNDTLYIPSYVAENPDTKLEEALGKAEFRYKVIDTKALDKLLLEGKRRIYFLSQTRFSEYKTIRITNSETGADIYGNHVNAITNKKFIFNKGDVSSINKAFD